MPRPKYMLLLELAGTSIVVLCATAESLLAGKAAPLDTDHVVLLTPKLVVPIQLPPYTYI